MPLSLERLSGQPNSPEDLAKLPQLHVSELPDEPLHIPTTVETVRGRPLLRNDIFSNGVNYLVLNFNLQGLPATSLAIPTEIHRCHRQTRCG